MQKRGVVVPEAYADFARKLFERMSGHSGPSTRSLDVAEVIGDAVSDPSRPIRQPAGADAVELARSS